ncbi:hypothetical protein BN439_2436 [Erwinia amylovora Ea644]|nr:hypothetical protein BN439_2436 [Erwinia amylovora Ea644]CCP07512.1 hypothetical protein BN440_2491 [Erwinia amylovora MR1]
MRQIDLPTILGTHNDILLTSALLAQHFYSVSSSEERCCREKWHSL